MAYAKNEEKQLNNDIYDFSMISCIRIAHKVL